MGRDRSHWEAAQRAFAHDEKMRDLDAAKLTPGERIVLGLSMGNAIPVRRLSDEELRQIAIEKGALHARARMLKALRGVKL